MFGRADISLGSTSWKLAEVVKSGPDSTDDLFLSTRIDISTLQSQSGSQNGVQVSFKAGARYIEINWNLAEHICRPYLRLSRACMHPLTSAYYRC